MYINSDNDGGKDKADLEKSRGDFNKPAKFKGVKEDPIKKAESYECETKPSIEDQIVGGDGVNINTCNSGDKADLHVWMSLLDAALSLEFKITMRMKVMEGAKWEPSIAS